jgi:hypothetical protein
MYTCKQRERDIDYQPWWVDAFNAVFSVWLELLKENREKETTGRDEWEVKIDRKYRQAGF